MNAVQSIRNYSCTVFPNILTTFNVKSKQIFLTTLNGWQVHCNPRYVRSNDTQETEEKLSLLYDMNGRINANAP